MAESTDRIVIVSIPGVLVEPINPEPMLIHLRGDINTDDLKEIKGGQSTWQMLQDALQAACDLLWLKAVEMKIPLKSIACVMPSDTKTFSYQLSDGTLAVTLLKQVIYL
ncbi:hypothetical protein BD769DRAFT_1662616 [Suillus cothurnatus]|nr:hypothetical protein BD769DRAFT_1662616 [Suillus cothurnatus]